MPHGHSHPLEKVNIRKFLHLIDVAFRLDDLLVVVQNPGFAFVGDVFADEGYVVAVWCICVSLFVIVMTMGKKGNGVRERGRWERLLTQHEWKHPYGTQYSAA